MDATCRGGALAMRGCLGCHALGVAGWVLDGQSWSSSASLNSWLAILNVATRASVHYEWLEGVV